MVTFIITVLLRFQIQALSETLALLLLSLSFFYIYQSDKYEYFFFVFSSLQLSFKLLLSLGSALFLLVGIHLWLPQIGGEAFAIFRLVLKMIPDGFLRKEGDICLIKRGSLLKQKVNLFFSVISKFNAFLASNHFTASINKLLLKLIFTSVIMALEIK